MCKLVKLVASLLFLVLSQSAIASEFNVLFVNGSHSNKAKLSLLKELASEGPITIDRKAQTELSDLNKAATVFAQYDLVILESISLRESKKIYAQYAPVVAQADNRFLAINWQDEASLNKGISDVQGKTVLDYYSNGGKENLARMLDYLAYRILSNNEEYDVAEPVIFPEIGIYHPDYDGIIFPSLAEYLVWRKDDDKNKPMVGILLQRALIESVETQLVDATIKQLEQQGVIAVPFFFELSEKTSDYNALIQQDNQTVVDVIINFRAIHWASKRKQEFTHFGVPVLQALTYYDGNQQHWEGNSQGITPGMTPFLLVLPEAAGVTDPMIVAALNDDTGRTEIIDYQLEHLVNKAVNLVNLKHKENADKRMTVMVWGSKDIGASFLNIPESLRVISDKLNTEGYGINVVDSDYFTSRIDRILEPFYRGYELDELLEDDLAELMPVSEYLAWFNTLPEEVRTPISDYWGEAKDNFMVVVRDGQSQFVLPRIRNGNMLVMRQPPRSDDKDEDKRIYHKGTVPMNHFYLAAYYYAREYWQSDAIIHLGTHGSQEYLSGKERGLSIYDQGNLAVWDTPILYPFIVDDVGEAMQTKRRGRATVLAHMTPPFAAAGLQGDMANIHELMHQYTSLDTGGVKEKTGQQIVNDCIANNICADFGWKQEQIDADFVGFLEALHSYLVDLSAQNQPLGLHSYGELPEQDLLISTLVQMLGSEFVTAVAEFENEHFDADNHAHHHDFNSSHAEKPKQREGFEDRIVQESGDSLEDIIGFKTVREFIVNAEQLDDEHLHELDDDIQTFIEQGREMHQRYTDIREMKHLIDGLAGKYIPVKNGGDPIRHPDAVPTGFNLYGFDPSRVPTKAAFEQGKELTEGVIADYYAKHGHYPDKLAFSLWSMETMRHYGVLESQALYAMGIRPTWSDDGRVIGSEIIPASELKRPRVDVVLSATGLYRDAFPNVMQFLAKAIEKVAALKEESNFVWRNSQRIKADLIAEGIEAKEAEYLSTVRVFSNASGNYGTGVEDAIFASDTWETDEKIADLYLSRMGSFYGSDNSRWGQKVENVDLYAKQLSGTDIALFSRSSNVYGMLSSDDPFQYFGSLAMAVRNLDGESPDMVISNLRDAKNPKAEAASEFLAKELRSRNFHKRWVEEMMKEGYSGAVNLSSHLSNFWGWQVVDPNLVRDDQWQEFYEVYINDKLELDINEWFEQANPESQAYMLERMLEANRKEYWQADEQTLKHMIERYVDLVEKYDVFVDNEKLREFVNGQAAGFGLTALPAPSADLPAAATESAAATQQVEGQQLEKVEQTKTAEQEWDWYLTGTFIFFLLMVLMGFWRQLVSQPKLS
ncbi:MAG: cobaltochelatase subunit CobN [Gammaproteobacteria bacterium]|nr:MAG: cobaltochelatase subunit CobN [Gammaproteobacteria bacterium]